MSLSPELVKGSIVPLVLALLEEREMYGYELVKVVNERTGGELAWKEGTLYPTLHRLEQEGLLRAVWRDKAKVEPTPGSASSGGPRQRKYYALTGKGRRHLAKHRDQWRRFSQAVNNVLLGGAV